jgi:hypothetical protein
LANLKSPEPSVKGQFIPVKGKILTKAKLMNRDLSLVTLETENKMKRDLSVATLEQDSNISLNNLVRRYSTNNVDRNFN